MKKGGKKSMPYTYEYARPAVTSDILLFHKKKEIIEVLLIRRKYPPFQDLWALPGGFIEMHETLEQAAIRELEEETGIVINKLEQFKTFDKPDRDPRGRTISTVFYSFLNDKPENIMASDDASEIGWFRSDRLPDLAFDHNDIIREAIRNLGNIQGI